MAADGNKPDTFLDADAQRVEALTAVTPVLLLWGVVLAFGFVLQYAVGAIWADFTDSNLWIVAAVWGALTALGLAAGTVIRLRAARGRPPSEGARKLIVRVVGFWAAVLVAAFVIPALAGLYAFETDQDVLTVMRIVVGIAVLGYIMFGVLFASAVFMAVGAAFGIAFYLSSLITADWWLLLAGGAMAAVFLAGAFWSRRRLRRH